jgi:hypothetical protein
MFGDGEWRTQAFLRESGWKREQGFLEYFKSKIKARYKLHFRIRFDVEDRVARSRAKYYLIHASNHAKAALLMKEVMWPLGDEEGLFDFSGEKHGVLFSTSPSEEKLWEALLREYVGKEVEFDQIREETWDLPFIEKHYRSVVKQLEKEGLVEITPVSSKTNRGLKKRDRVRFLPPRVDGFDVEPRDRLYQDQPGVQALLRRDLRGALARNSGASLRTGVRSADLA